MAKQLPSIKEGAPFIFQIGEGQWACIKLLKDLPEGTFEITPTKVDTVIFNQSESVQMKSSIVHNEYQRGQASYGKTFIG